MFFMFFYKSSNVLPFIKYLKTIYGVVYYTNYKNN